MRGLGLLACLLLAAIPARAQLLADIIDHPVVLEESQVEQAGKALRTRAISLPVFTSFTGMAIEMTSSAPDLDGRIRIREGNTFSEWIPLHFVRSFTQDFFVAGFHGDRVWSSTWFEIEVSGPSESPVFLLNSGVFDNRNDEDRRPASEPAATGSENEQNAEDLIVPPPLITRADWNAAPFQLGNPVPLANPSYDYMTFHHAAGYSATTYEEGLAQLKAIQDLHQNIRGWSDIGYQFVIDRAGRVYQGRPFLDSSTTLAQEPRLALGAHVGGFNTGNIGICMLGCYHPPEGGFCQEVPTPESLESYVTMFAFLSERYGPAATSIRGHRDWSSTACPGDNNYVLLPSIREDVASLLITGNQAIATAELSVVPGADGIVRISWAFVEDFGVYSYRLERTVGDVKAVLIESLGAEASTYSDPELTGSDPATYALYVSSVDGRTQRVATADVELNLPNLFVLAEVFPNPAVSSASVRFFLPYEAYVKVQLHDGAGRLVQTVRDEFHSGDEWIVSRLEFDGYASGMYYYRIQVEGFSGTVFDETRGIAVIH